MTNIVLDVRLYVAQHTNDSFVLQPHDAVAAVFNPWQKLRLKEKLNEMRGQVKFLNLPYFGYALFLWPKLTPSSEAAPADAGS
mmetsp:Transcript_30878/g.43035  ORF Transcript_30878/g.43035 Transcript_30878/m.43035 type:complete len:83 (+) Transcript_30878:246-494(+)